MFLEISDLGGVIYKYQIEQITEGNNDITLQAIAAAESEVRSYLVANNKREWNDGRLKYDIEKIFSAKGDKRNTLLVSHTCTIAKYYIAELCNADFLYERTKERYDRAISWLKQLAKGDVNLDNLPQINDDLSEDKQSTFIYGSRPKFNHE